MTMVVIAVTWAMTSAPIRILGIDPGLRRTGWGVIDVDGNRLIYVGCGSVESRDTSPLAERLRALHADPAIVLWAMIESPLGVLSAQEIAATAREGDKRLAGFIIGPNDIARETRMRMLPGRAAMLPLFSHCILAARAYGIEILDGPYNDISDIAGFAKECAQGRDMGFDGKTLIHPGQIDAANAAYTPAAEDVARARKIMGVFDLPENVSKGVVQLDGQMVERLHVEMAKRTIAIADAIAALKAG